MFRRGEGISLSFRFFPGGDAGLVVAESWVVSFYVYLYADFYETDVDIAKQKQKTCAQNLPALQARAQSALNKHPGNTTKRKQTTRSSQKT